MIIQGIKHWTKNDQTGNWCLFRSESETAQGVQGKGVLLKDLSVWDAARCKGHQKVHQ